VSVLIYGFNLAKLALWYRRCCSYCSQGKPLSAK